MQRRSTRSRPSLLALTAFCLACGESSGYTADTPLHLEDHLDDATVVGSEVPGRSGIESVKWTFDRPQSEWRPMPVASAELPVVPQGFAVQLELTPMRPGQPLHFAGMYVDLPGWNPLDWAHVLVRARAKGGVQALKLFFNTSADRNGLVRPDVPGMDVYLIRDGSVRSYYLPADQFQGSPLTEAWRQLVIGAWGTDSGSVEILSVTAVPKASLYADSGAGLRTELKGRAIRSALYMHAPGRLGYRLRVPDGGRLDFGLGVLSPEVPVTFRVTVGSDGDEPQLLFDESYDDASAWGQRSLDLSGYAGRDVELALDASADEAGTVALWAAPTLSGARADRRPNVILYVIDGGAASYMSLYGYNRRTTPNLERLAREGVVFENAYSNASWTKPSTTSFVTSLHSSVLGNWRTETDPLPDSVVTLAEHFHRAGYHTGLFTTNSYVGQISGMERGHDVMREAGARPNSASSRELHEDFWRWREQYPGEPFYVHIQTTDVHYPYDPLAPFAGLYLDPEQRRVYDDWNRRLRETGLPTPIRAWSESFDRTGIGRPDFYAAQRRLYDECLAQNDAGLGRLVERLKAAGEWENTLLVVASDHGAAWWVMDIDPPPPFNDPILAAYWSRIPLVVVWPGHIVPGRRVQEPVSMIDVLPTLLDLAGLQPPRILQGQSLEPLLMGTGAWRARPVIFDQAQAHAGEVDRPYFHLEVVEGRWGASLLVHPDSGAELELPEGRTAALQVYDLWDDPNALHPINAERGDLVERYREFLEARWAAHRALAQHVGTVGAEVVLTAEQLENLRALGYLGYFK